MTKAAKRFSLIVLIAIVSMLGSIPSSLGASGTGTITLSHALTRFAPTAVEVEFKIRNCNPANLLTTNGSSGADALIVDMVSNTHIRAKVVSTPDTLSDSLNIVFYDSGCNYKSSDSVWNAGSNVYKNANGDKWAVISGYGTGLFQDASLPNVAVGISWTTCSPNGNPATSCGS